MFPSFALLTIIRPRPVWPSLEGRFSPTAAGCFPSKVFPFCQAQPFMCANAVFFVPKIFGCEGKTLPLSAVVSEFKINPQTCRVLCILNCEGQGLVWAQPVFLCQRFLVVNAKLSSFMPLWGSLKPTHKPQLWRQEKSCAWRASMRIKIFVQKLRTHAPSQRRGKRKRRRRKWMIGRNDRKRSWRGQIWQCSNAPLAKSTAGAMHRQASAKGRTPSFVPVQPGHPWSEGERDRFSPTAAGCFPLKVFSL